MGTNASKLANIHYGSDPEDVKKGFSWFGQNQTGSELQEQIAEQKAQLAATRKKEEEKLLRRLRARSTPQQSIVDGTALG